MHLEKTREDILTLPRLNVRGRSLYDLELLLVGGFAPVTGFMDEEEYVSVVKTMRLTDGSLFPIPIVLDVEKDAPYTAGDRLLLCDQFGNPLAIMHVTSRYTPDKNHEAKLVYGTTDTTHPGVSYLFYEMHETYLGGSLEHVALPKRHDFVHLRHTPIELKSEFQDRGWDRIIAFQTRNPMHRAHYELVRRAHERINAPVLIHPVVGMTKPGDIDYGIRVRTYNVIANTYGKDMTYLSLLPLAMRMAGPRELLWHMIIRKNYGCTHLISGRDHAGPGSDAKGTPFYGAYEARDLGLQFQDEIGIEIIPSEELIYSKTRDRYITAQEKQADEVTESISGTEFRRRLVNGEEIPEWFSFKENIEILKQGLRKDVRPGLTIFFTGLSGAGKSTIAQLLLARLQEIQDRQITFLDGDVIREHLTKGLGFSKEDRDENVKRVGFVASEVARHGGIAITSLIAPYREARKHARTLTEQFGTFIEIYIATPIEECERRDTKGLYAKARRGDLKGFTGVDDPYESPANPELIFTTVASTPEEVVSDILVYLKNRSVL